MEWEYEELFEAINDGYEEYKAEYMSNSEAFARTVDDFEAVKNTGIFEKSIVTVALGELLIRQSKVFKMSKEYLLSTLESIDIKGLEPYLTPELFANWNARKDLFLQEIDKKPVHNYARAFWSVDEMTAEVSQFFMNILSQNKSGDEIVLEVLNRFERDRKHSLSEDIVVLTTLAEKLLQNKLTETSDLKSIIFNLKSFNEEEIVEELLEEEWVELGIRIKNVLTNLASAE
ncbi:Imm3 family immunity protein [Paenibacillus sp. NPDC058071]|uniref:Imm3 family immunity protein n=1 Tax=Paenibacillus sp. NPDC058071 TaxID=3346326 RepID=UPI0036DE0D98